MKICWDQLCRRAAFAAVAAAATLWVSSSIAAAAAPDVPDRDGEADDGILGDGAIDSAGATVEQANPAAVGDYLENLVAAMEDATGQSLLSGPSIDLIAQDCAELTLPDADEMDFVAQAAEPAAADVDVLVDVEPEQAVEEAAEPVVEPIEAVAEPEAVVPPIDSVDADVIVGDAAAATEAQDLAAEWSLDAARAESFTFDDAAADTSEDTTAAPTEPEAAPTEAAPTAGPEALAASAWFQTVLERYHARPLGASTVRPVFCGLAEPNGSLGF